MQQYYRIALGMCLLIGYLQAQPLRFNKDDLGLDRLNLVSCKPGVNFTAPKAVKGSCCAATLKLFMEGWEHATNNCVDTLHIHQTLDALSYVLETQSQTQCNFTTTVHEQFASFVTATKTFAELCNSENLQE